jgi:hypothetical protein
MWRLPAGAAWLVSAGACLCAIACGQTNESPIRRSGTAGGADEPARAGSAGVANDAGGGTANNAGGPAREGGGTSVTLPTGGRAVDSETEPVPVPHAGRSCENPEPYPDGGGYLVCQDKSLRRGEPSDCPSTLPRESPTLPLFYSDCALDTDCTASPHGFCALGQCRFGCVSDDECGPEGICFCGAEIGKCLQAVCRSDAECPSGYPCTGNQPFGSPDVSFRCQTPYDECQSDYDCPGARMHCISEGEHRYCWHDPIG